MATKPSELNQTIDDQFTKKALDWFYTLSEDGTTCPVCGNEFFDGTEKQQKANLINHGRMQHIARIVAGYPTKNIDAITQIVDESDDVFDVAGIQKIEDLSKHDFLAVPPEIARIAKKDGANMRWVSGNNLERFRHHGMEVVKDNDGNPVRSGDLILHRIPNRLRARYKAERDRRNANAPAARREDLERRVEGVAKNMYDAALKKGLGRDVAKNLANAAERGLTTGVLNVRRG